MNKTKILAAALLTTALVATGASCAGTTVEAGDEDQAPICMPALNPYNLAGTNWVLSGYGDSAVPTAVLDGTRVTLAFSDSVDKVSGNAGCNLYGAKASITDGMISLSDMYATEMALIDPGAMAQESAFLKLLGDAQSWSVQDGTLTFQCGSGVLVFTGDTA
jgi:heat shock protein HslJ